MESLAVASHPLQAQIYTCTALKLARCQTLDRRSAVTALPSVSEIPFPSSCFETRSSPDLLAATLAALPSISEIPFLDSCVPNLIFSESNVSGGESGDGIGQVRFSGCAEKHCASN